MRVSLSQLSVGRRPLLSCIKHGQRLSLAHVDQWPTFHLCAGASAPITTMPSASAAASHGRIDSSRDAAVEALADEGALDEAADAEEEAEAEDEAGVGMGLAELEAAVAEAVAYRAEQEHGVVATHEWMSLALRGGKGGFGALLRTASLKPGQKKTTNNTASRDLNGRRLRHIEMEKTIASWEPPEHGASPAELAAKYRNIKLGKALELKPCKFGDECKYQWKCKYTHPHEAVDELEHKKRTNLGMTFGKPDEPVPESDDVIDKVSSAVEVAMERLKKEQAEVAEKKKQRAKEAKESKEAAAAGSDSKESKTAGGKRKASGEAGEAESEAASSEPFAAVDDDDFLPSIYKKKARTTSESESASASASASSPTASASASASSSAAATVPASKKPTSAAAAGEAVGAGIGAAAPSSSASSSSSSSATADNSGDSKEEKKPTVAAAAAPADAKPDSKKAKKRQEKEEKEKEKTATGAAAAPAVSYAAIELKQYTSASAMLSALGVAHVTAELSRVGLKAGGRPDERAERLWLLRDTTLDKLPKKHLAPPPAKKSA